MRSMASPTVARALAALTLVLCGAGGVAAQTEPATRSAVTIDYVTADGVYLPVGSDRGLHRGDTIDVYGDEGAPEPVARIVFTSVTRRRSVATPLDPSAPLHRGDVVFLPLAAPATAADAGASPVRADAPSVAAPTPTGRPDAPATGSPPPPAPPLRRGPSVSGRLALDLDAHETRTSWEGALFGETRRRFATPTTRLAVTVEDLPGGMTVRSNLRASYRYTELDVGPPPTSVRFYELAVIKAFQGFPAEVRLGRFRNPYESYSAYWDGMLLRIGRARGPGIGVVAGVEPTRANEGFSSDRPKVTAFADFSAGSGSLRYATDVSLHALRPTLGVEQAAVGWSQRLTLGRLTLTQRFRADRAGTGPWELGQLRVRGRMEISRPLSLHASYMRGRSGTLGLPLGPLAPDREEFSGGLGLRGRAGSLGLDAGATRRGGDELGLSVSASGAVRLGVASLLVSGHHWSRGQERSMGLAPAVSFPIAGTQMRLGYRLYETASPLGTLLTHAVDARAGAELMPGLRVSLQAQQQWGARLVGTHLRIGIWRSF